MLILDNVKVKFKEARKSRNKSVALVLSTVIGELETISKRTGEEITDSQVVKYLRKVIDNNTLVIKETTNTDVADKLKAEIVVLTQFLPKQLTESELLAIIESMKSSIELKSKELLDSGKKVNVIAEAMSQLKSNYAGLYDGAMAAKLIKKILS